MRLTSLKLESVEDLFLEELRDLYDAESQLLKALPKLAEAATTPALKMAFSQHLDPGRGRRSGQETHRSCGERGKRSSDSDLSLERFQGKPERR
jgi:ferritin-like metal-binding protein YciE